MNHTKLFFRLCFATILTFFLQSTSQAQLKANEGVTAKAFIGVNFHHVSNYTAQEKGYPNKYGSYIVNTIEGTNAKSSGLLQGDYITGINEYYVKQDFTITDILKKYCPGDRVTLHILRGENEKKNVDITLVAYKLSKNMIEKAFLGVNYGVLNSLEENTGAIIGDVIPHSSAEEMGMQKNDIIKKINDRELNTWDDLSSILREVEVGKEIKVVFERAGQTLEGSTFIKNKANTYYHNCVPAVEKEEAKIETVDNELVETDPNTNSIKIYPNPNEGIFTVSFKFPEEGNTGLQILDSKGQSIYFEEKIEKPEGSSFYTQDFDLSRYPKGVYFVQVSIDGKELFTRRTVLR